MNDIAYIEQTDGPMKEQLAVQDSLISHLMTFGPPAWYAVAGKIHREMFHAERRQIFDTIEKINRRGEVADLVTVPAEIEDQKHADTAHQIGIKNPAVSIASIPSYVRHLTEQYRRNQARDIGAQLVQSGDLDKARSQIQQLDSESGSATIDARQALQDWQDVQERKESGENRGIKSRLKDLDKILYQMEPADLVVIAGRPSMGKTTLACNIVGRCGVPATIFSLEMSTAQLISKMISAHGIDYHRVKTREGLTDEDHQAMSKASQFIFHSGLLINETGGIFISQLEAEARRAVKSHGSRLIVIDYFQLVRCKAENRLEEVSEVSRSLKRIAKDLDVPVILISQLNREVEKRMDQKPRLSDLRETGQLEQDADIVVFVHRPEVFRPGNRPGQADLIVAKHREGETGECTVTWQGQFQRFVDRAPDYFKRSK